MFLFHFYLSNYVYKIFVVVVVDSSTTTSTLKKLPQNYRIESLQLL